MPTCLQQLLSIRLFSSILRWCYYHMGSDHAISVAGKDGAWTPLFTVLADVGRSGKKKKRGVKSCQAVI